MDMKRFFLYAIVIAALALAGCGGNGGGDMAMNGDGNGDGNGNGTPMQCPEGQTGTYPDCEPITPARPAPSMALVTGIVAANNDDNGATNPASYSDDNRPGKMVTGDPAVRDGDVVLLGSISDAGANTERVKTDGTIGDVSIAAVSVSGGTETFPNPIKLTKSDDMPPSVGSFADGSVHSRTHMDVTDTVYVYETRSAPGAQLWNSRYTEGETSDGVTAIAAPTTQLENMQSFNVLTFAADVRSITKRFMSDMFPSGAAQVYTYYDTTGYGALNSDQKGPSTVNGRKLEGMFEGIPGEYSCSDSAADGCTVRTNSRGEVVAFAGTWMFTPTNLATGVTGHMVQGVVNDADYLTFGYWVQKDESDDLEIGVSTFASGSALVDDYITAFANLEGDATYDGKAVGKFVQKTLSPAGVSTITDGGTFTADATLTAYFGGNDISFSDKFTIGGIIDEFENSDGDTIDSRWSVTLRSTTFATTGDKSAAGTTFTGTTSAGGPAGNWGGAFYGTPMTSTGAPDLPVSDTNTDPYPTSVAGEFDAHFTNGHVLGAFGATR